MNRYVVATCYLALPWSKNPTPWYLVIERTTNVSSDWKIKLGTDDKALAEKECSRLNDDNGRERLEKESAS